MYGVDVVLPSKCLRPQKAETFDYLNHYQLWLPPLQNSHYFHLSSVYPCPWCSYISWWQGHYDLWNHSYTIAAYFYDSVLKFYVQFVDVIWIPLRVYHLVNEETTYAIIMLNATHLSQYSLDFTNNIFPNCAVLEHQWLLRGWCLIIPCFPFNYKTTVFQQWCILL